MVRWHSFQETKHRPNSLVGQMVGSLTVGQLLVLRKLALLKLTAIMERYCPTHRTGWNWELPKFMRKTRMPDPKGTVKHILLWLTSVRANSIYLVTLRLFIFLMKRFIHIYTGLCNNNINNTTKFRKFFGKSSYIK